jgi:hypothetical protein
VLGLVRKLIAFGREIVATLQGHNTPDATPALARQFGSLSLTLIIARITRGLMLAAALEDRLQRNPSATTPRATQPVTRAPRPPSPPAPRPSRRAEPDEEAELRQALPSAREIAERIRKRPVGAVIVEICRDLGIDGFHPLWGEVLQVIRFHGGNLWRLLLAIRHRGDWALRQNLPLPPLPDYLLPREPDLVAAFARPP